VGKTKIAEVKTADYETRIHNSIAKISGAGAPGYNVPNDDPLGGIRIAIFIPLYVLCCWRGAAGHRAGI
jgi:hypothetical protein